MSSFDGDCLYKDLCDKIETEEKLNDKDKLNLIFLPLMKTKLNKNEMAINAVDLACRVKNDEEKMLYVGAIVGISDKFIDKEYIFKLKERLRMTKVGIELKKEGIKEAKLENALKMVIKGFSIEDIMEITGLNKEVIQKLQEINKTQN